MRSIRMLAAVIGTLALVSACGDGGGTPPPPENEAPVANFTLPACTINVACSFVSTSTDDVAVTGWSWDFNGDGTADASTSTAPYTYTAAGTFNVSLTVTDAASLTNTKTSPITIAPLPPPVNVPPVAGFTFTCDAARVCVFTNTSTDADGTITTNAWVFGEPSSGAANQSSEQNPTHTYAAVTSETNFTVTLTVTDDDGATNVATQTVTIQPPPVAVCNGSGVLVNCVLEVTQRSTMKFILVSRACEIGGNKLEIRQPIIKNIFFNGCSAAPGTEYPVMDASGTSLRVFDPGQVQVRFTQGALDPTDPPAGAPAIRIEGTFPTWTLNIDDGGNVGRPGEPDFTDIIVRVELTRVQ